MTKVYEISRADLKKGAYKKVALVEKTGKVPVRRDIELLARVLVKAVQR